MLPFLKPKQAGSVVEYKMHEDGDQEPMREEGEHSPGMMSAAEDLISAIHSKDAKAVADAMKAHHDLHMAEETMEGDDAAY